MHLADSCYSHRLRDPRVEAFRRQGGKLKPGNESRVVSDVAQGLLVNDFFPCWTRKA